MLWYVALRSRVEVRLLEDVGMGVVDRVCTWSTCMIEDGGGTRSSVRREAVAIDRFLEQYMVSLFMFRALFCGA